jgi:3-oxoadipate enol-lactonase
MPYINSDDGARIYYRVTGPAGAEPIVLIMGLGWDMSGWDLLVPHLKGFRVLRLDNRGTGRSDKPQRPYSMQQLALDVALCMTAAGFDSAHVYGASLGSMIAQELALGLPGRIRTLILGCPSPGVISFPGSLGMLRVLLNREELTPEESFWAATPYLYGRSLTERPEAIAEVMQRRMASRADPGGVRRQLEAVLRWSSLRRLRNLRMPTLVIHGDHDRLIPIANGRLIATLVPGAHLHVLKGAGHVYGTDAPEEHLATLLAWLELQAKQLEATA